MYGCYTNEYYINNVIGALNVDTYYLSKKKITSRGTRASRGSRGLSNTLFRRPPLPQPRGDRGSLFYPSPYPHILSHTPLTVKPSMWHLIPGASDTKITITAFIHNASSSWHFGCRADTFHLRLLFWLKSLESIHPLFGLCCHIDIIAMFKGMSSPTDVYPAKPGSPCLNPSVFDANWNVVLRITFNSFHIGRIPLFEVLSSLRLG